MKKLVLFTYSLLVLFTSLHYHDVKLFFTDSHSFKMSAPENSEQRIRHEDLCHVDHFRDTIGLNAAQYDCCAILFAEVIHIELFAPDHPNNNYFHYNLRAPPLKKA